MAIQCRAYGSATAEKQAAWSVLNLPPGSSKKQIRSRFRKLAATEHPDKRPGDPQAAERFSRIIAAYEALMTDDPVFEEETRYESRRGAASAIPVEEAEARFRRANGGRSAKSPEQEGNALEFVALGSGLIVVAAIMFKVLGALSCPVTGEFCDDGVDDIVDLSLGISAVDDFPPPGAPGEPFLQDAAPPNG